MDIKENFLNVESKIFNYIESNKNLNEFVNFEELIRVYSCFYNLNMFDSIDCLDNNTTIGDLQKTKELAYKQRDQLVNVVINSVNQENKKVKNIIQNINDIYNYLNDFYDMDDYTFSLKSGFKQFKPITWEDFLSLNLEHSKYFKYIKEVVNNLRYDLDLLEIFGLYKTVLDCRLGKIKISNINNYDQAKKFKLAYNIYNHVENNV